MVKKVLGPTTDFPTWESGKRTKNPQGIWLWRPVGFDYRTYTRLGKQTLGGYKQKLVCPRTQKKGAVIPQKTDPDLTVSVQESPREVWVSDGLLQGQGHWVRQCVHTFKGGHHDLHYLHHSLVSGQTGKKHSPIHQQRIGLKIYWTWPHPSEQDPVSPTVSLFQQEVSINLLSLSLRGQTEWKPQSQKTNQTDLIDNSLV